MDWATTVNAIAATSRSSLATASFAMRSTFPDMVATKDNAVISVISTS